MFIQTELTPNPQTLKFLPGRVVMKEGTAFYKNRDEVLDSPFAKRLFNIDGVNGVFFGSDFITITKSDELDWQIMKPILLGAIMDHFNSDEDTIIQDKINQESKNVEQNANDSDVVKQIKELLDTRVRPAVAMDGGDIVYDSFEDGIVYLQMQGACSGCPSSTATLKMGIENMLKHYVPEVIEVRPVDV
jgi:Fe-S cluster biogenesis protein NfuA